jgi:hypothetical protein
MINGRIHKASYKEFLRTEDRPAAEAKVEEAPPKLTNFVAYSLDDGTGRTRMGHLDPSKGTITPLAFPGGTPIENLYQVLEIGEDKVQAGGDAFPLTSRHVLPAHLRPLVTLAA